jgi:voltage-gated potassium channel
VASSPASFPRRPPRKRAQQHYLLRALNRARGWLGPALLVAVMILVGLMVLGFVVLLIGERDNPNMESWFSAAEWVFLALVAKPPWSVQTPAGESVEFLMNLLRPSSIALITAAFTSFLFGSLVKRVSGAGRTRVKDHIVICGWSGKGTEIIREMRGRGDEQSRRPAVVLAKLTQSPTKDELTTFISGDPTNAQDLERAGIKNARTAIVLADNSYPDLDVEDMDSRTLLTVLAIESLNPDCYTCVEVVQSANRPHFARTKADELVVSAHLTGALLAHSASTHGLSRVVGDLLTFPEGNEFYWISVPEKLVGVTFKAALSILKQNYDALAVAISSEQLGGPFDYRTNPPANHELGEHDRLLVIAPQLPRI